MLDVNNFMLLTQQGGILKPFAKLLGWILEGIFFVLDKIGIPNTGLSIILFTIIIYVLMLPLTVKQQKFSKLQAKMSPELNAIRKKYEGKNSDPEAMQRMNQETNAIYAKYGVSPSGSCIQLLIQMPILLALYRVIYNMPAYVGQIKDVYLTFVNQLVAEKDSFEFLETLSSAKYFTKQFANGVADVPNFFIDVLNRASSADWDALINQYPNLAGSIRNASDILANYNTFFGINIGDSPSFIIKEAFNADVKNWPIIIGAILIPVLSCITQWINFQLMPQMNTESSGNQNDQAEAMMSSMKTMNKVMPIMSAVFCYSLPVGMGLYWIAGAVVRGIIQVCINKHLDKIDVDEMVAKNVEKMNEKRAKQGLPSQQINSNATINTRNISKKDSNENTNSSKGDRAAKIKESTDYYNNANIGREGTLASKAFMVKQYNEKNSSKND